MLQSSLTEGCRLPVRMHGTEDWPLAEIISIRDVQGKLMFYVHYVDCKLYFALFFTLYYMIKCINNIECLCFVNVCVI